MFIYNPPFFVRLTHKMTTIFQECSPPVYQQICLWIYKLRHWVNLLCKIYIYLFHKIPEIKKKRGVLFNIQAESPVPGMLTGDGEGVVKGQYVDPVGTLLLIPCPF